MSLYDVSNVLVGLALAPAIVFVLLYTRSPWRQTAMGRHVMGYGVVIALLLAVALWVRTGPHPGQGIVSAILFAALIVILWRQVIFLIRAQRGDE